MSIQIEIIVNTNPDNSRYKTIQYSNQIHTTVDTNPYTSRYNSIQQSIQYNSPNAKLHIVDTLVHTTYSPYTSPNAKLHTVQSSCYSQGRRRWRWRRRPRQRLQVALPESHPHCCGVLLRRHVLIDWPIIGRRRLRLHIIIEDIICVSQDQSLLVIISKSLQLYLKSLVLSHAGVVLLSNREIKNDDHCLDSSCSIKLCYPKVINATN